MKNQTNTTNAATFTVLTVAYPAFSQYGTTLHTEHADTPEQVKSIASRIKRDNPYREGLRSVRPYITKDGQQVSMADL